MTRNRYLKINRYSFEKYEYRRQPGQIYGTYITVTDPTQYDSLYLGDLRDDPAGQLYEIPHTMYSDYSGDTVHRSNCDVLLEDFKDRQSKGLWEVYGGHGTRGIVVDKDTLESDEMQDILYQLENYPLISDDHHSQLEYEIETEAWQDYIRDDLLRALHAADIDTDELEEEEDKLYTTFNEAMERANVYYEHQDSYSVYIDLDEIVLNWKA